MPAVYQVILIEVLLSSHRLAGLYSPAPLPACLSADRRIIWAMPEGTKTALHENKRYEQISPTAWPVAFRRIFSGIPYCTEIFDEMKKAQAIPIDPELMRPDLSPQIEARFRIISRALSELGIKQVLELAAGFSPRGLIMSEDPSCTYVELDLLPVIELKKQIVKSLEESGVTEHRPNLVWQPENVLKPSDLDEAVSGFDTYQPVVVVHEGLMRYLTMDERAQLAQNVHGLLTKFGGAWVTPDVSLRKVFENENEADRNHIQKISELTGSDIVGNRFESKEQAQEFFENLGFDVKSRSWLEVTDELVSPQRLGISPEAVQEMNSLPVLLVMTVR